jgi:AcrR family transcriptional regulator
VLIERGWAAVTAIEVCTRAGVSRGAFHHHYDGLPGLLADALGRLYAAMTQPGRPPPAHLPGLIDSAWATIGNARFKAVLEAWLAMANDPGLREEIGPVAAEFSALVSADAMGAVLSSARHRDFYLLARETMLGLALGRATNRGRPLRHERAVLTQLRAAAATLDG